MRISPCEACILEVTAFSVVAIITEFGVLHQISDTVVLGILVS